SLLSCLCCAVTAPTALATLSLHDALPIYAGAITIHGLLQQYAGGDAVNLILDTMSQMAGRDLRLNRDVARGEAKTGYRNRAIAKDRKSTRLNSSHVSTSYAVLCLKRKSKT